MPDIKRMRYFDQQLLVLEDFTDEQDYHVAMRQRHNQLLHTPGIANGLEVVKNGAKKVTVKAGMAINESGQEIVLDANTDVDLVEFVSGDRIAITIKYKPVEDKPTGDPPQNRRILEKSELKKIKMGIGVAIDKSEVQLALITMAGTDLDGIDLTVRRQAGASAFDNPDAALTVRSLRLSNQAFPNTQWPTLTASAANQVTVGGSLLAQNLGAISDINLNGNLKAAGDLSGRNLNLSGNLSVTGALSALANAGVTGNLSVGGILSASGNVGVGTSTPAAKLQVVGGAIMPAIGNSAQAGIQFPANPGGGGGDEAFIRYFVTAGETTKLQIGIGNDADDALSLVQAGAERLTIVSGNIGIGTTTPGAALDVVGSLRSTMWDVFQLYNSQQGPLPLSKQFNTSGGTLVLFTSGSGWISTGGGIAGMEVRVDNVKKADLRATTNEASSHKAFVANPIVVAGIAAGQHTLSLIAHPGTSTDQNDFFSVTVLELPWAVPIFRPPILTAPGDVVLIPR